MLPHFTDQYSHRKERPAFDKEYEAKYVICHVLTDCYISVKEGIILLQNRLPKTDFDIDLGNQKIIPKATEDEISGLLHEILFRLSDCGQA